MLLDECLPRKLANHLTGYKVTTVPRAGWAGLTNGALMARIGGSFDVFITVDQNLPAQQNLTTAPFGVIVIRARSNALGALLPLVPGLLAALDRVAGSRFEIVSEISQIN